MATPQGDGSIILTTAIDQSGLKKGIGNIKSMAKTATKAFLAVGAAAATATIAIAKASVDAFAEYEQLVGGVETLFKGSSKKLIEYANEAFRTSGLSANEFMSTVTSFSASLISSLGGDTEKAADIANQALIDMSDNANKMGTSMESIQLAYQGFSRQQYQLLDNLKLGYGGTRGEMERLLKDAQALTGVEYDISNLADVYTAIHVIQENLGIAGTTALEAEKTISGSAATMKAAWQNVLTAISGGGDLDRAIENLVDSISNYFENIVPVIERALSGIGRLIEKVAPMLVQTVVKSLIAAIPSLLNAVYEMIVGLAKGIYQGIVDLFNGVSREALIEQADNIEQSVENQKELTAEVEKTNKAVNKGLASFDEINILTGETFKEDMPESIVPEIGGSSLSESLEIEETEKEFSSFEKNIRKIFKRIPQIFEPVINSLANLWEQIKPNNTELKNAYDWLTNEVFSPFLNYVSQDFLPNGINLITEGFKSLEVSIETLKQPIVDFWANTLKPVFQEIGEWINTIINETTESFAYFSEKCDEYKEEISAVVNLIETIFGDLWAVLGPILDAIMGTVGDVLKTTLDLIFSVISALGNWFSFFENIGKGIIAIFKGNWDEAGEYFKNALANFVNFWVGIANAIISIINNLWSLIFNAFRGAINAVGGLIERFGDFIGKDWDLHWDAKAPLIPEIPKYIPKLAKGAVIPPNREFLAVLGDQKSGTNIEAPLSTIQEAVSDVVGDKNEALKNLLSRSVELQQEILEAVLGIEIGDEVIGNSVNRYNNRMAVIHGG